MTSSVFNVYLSLVCMGKNYNSNLYSAHIIVRTIYHIPVIQKTTQVFANQFYYTHITY